MLTAFLCLACAAVAEAAFPGRPGRIGFVASTRFAYGNVIWDYDPSTKVRRRLTMRNSACRGRRRRSYWNDGPLSYSPDGRRIAYVHADDCGRDRARRYQLRVMRSDGSHNRLVTRSPEFSPPFSNAAFSPDGRRVALSHGDGLVTLFETATRAPIRSVGLHASLHTSTNPTLLWLQAQPHT
jgi:Tol biopolymer transport system component